MLQWHRLRKWRISIEHKPVNIFYLQHGFCTILQQFKYDRKNRLVNIRITDDTNDYNRKFYVRRETFKLARATNYRCSQLYRRTLG